MKFLLVIIGILSLYGLGFLMEHHAPVWLQNEAFKMGSVALSYANTAMLGLFTLIGVVIAKTK